MEYDFSLSILGVRGALRQAYKIDGNVIEDFFSILLVYPLAAVQMDEQTDLVPLPNNNNDNIEMGIENPMMQGEIAVIQHGDEHANVIHL